MIQANFLKSKLNLEDILNFREYIVTGLIVVAFLFLDVFFLQTFLVPAQKHLSEAKDTQSLISKKPNLEILLKEANQLLSNWESGASPMEGSTAILREIQTLATTHRVQVKEMSAGGRQSLTDSENKSVSGGGFSSEKITLQAFGPFNNLAHWVDDMEDKPGLFVESWNLAPEQEGSDNCRLDLNINIVSRNS